MKIASFDIGIKNLAYCIYESESNLILDWGIINLAEKIINELPKCITVKKGKKCEKLAINYIITDSNFKIYYCGKKYCQDSLKSNYPNSKIKKIKKFKTKSIPLVELGKLIFENLNKNKLFIECSKILIENQPVLKNPTMKSIQMIVYSFFLFNNINDIVLFNPNKKLDVYSGPVVECNLKNEYSKRKYLSIKYTEYFLRESNQNEKILNMFNNSPKKDDLSDCYLQCLTYIKKKNE